jgi:hypothetical protein
MNFAPGTSQQYSHTDNVILGQAIERATGESIKRLNCLVSAPGGAFLLAGLGTWSFTGLPSTQTLPPKMKHVPRSPVTIPAFRRTSLVVARPAVQQGMVPDRRS